VNKGRLLALAIAAATLLLLVVGTVWPVASAVAYAGGGKGDLLAGASACIIGAKHIRAFRIKLNLPLTNSYMT
jgi:hypothetical protein